MYCLLLSAITAGCKEKEQYVAMKTGSVSLTAAEMDGEQETGTVDDSAASGLEADETDEAVNIRV